MNTFRITINPDAIEPNLSIITRYWELDNLEFVNKPSQLTKQYHVSQYKLNKIVSQNSECNIEYGVCVDCEKLINEKVYSQSAFKHSINFEKDRCQDCYYAYIERLNQQSDREWRLAAENKKNRCLEFVNSDNLKKLSPHEREVLTQIVRIKDRNKIFVKVFKDEFHNTWKVVNKLEKLGLLLIERNNDGKVLNFWFNESLENELISNEGDENIAIIDSYTFNIPLVQGERKSPKSPQYSKGFKLPSTVIFKKDVEYLLGCWVLTDGSLNFTFTPKNKIIQSEDFTLSDEENERVVDASFPPIEDNDSIDNDKFSNFLDPFDVDDDYEVPF